MTVPTTSRPLLTVSPTRLERLLACPLRIAFEQATAGGGAGQDSPWALVGVAIHRTIELCLRDPPVDLHAAWASACEEVADSSGDPREAPSARRSFLRLQRRLPELIEYIAQREPTETRRECTLTSPDGALTGQIDLLVLGARPAVVDHKTGVVLTDGVPRGHYERQLAIYAWVVEASLGVEVDDAALFSLRDGIVEVDVSRSVRQRTVVEAIDARYAFNARAPGVQPATPSDHACGMCPFVGRCDPTWDALQQGRIDGFGWGDAARGRVMAPIVRSAGGTAALPLEVHVGTITGDAMLIDVPTAMVEECSVGDEVSAWRLARRSDEPLTLGWREGTSALQLNPIGPVG